MKEMTDKSAIKLLAEQIEKHAFRRGCVSAFTLAAFPVKKNEELAIHITRECEGLIYGNAEVGSPEAFKACIDALDGRTDYIFWDTGLYPDVFNPGLPRSFPVLKSSVLLSYDDQDVWTESVKYILMTLVPDLRIKKALVISSFNNPEFTNRLLNDLRFNLGETSVLKSGDSFTAFTGIDIIIGAAIYEQVITRELIGAIDGNPLIVDAGIGTLTPSATSYAHENGLSVIRVDNRAAMAGTLFSLIQSYDLVTRVMGSGEIDGVRVVAGGIVGKPGDIIVDSIDSPSVVIGIADGTGKVRYLPENEEERVTLEKVKAAISERRSNE
ncbi:MAG: hypothetical protein ABIC40_03505 [bacterium]